MHTLCAQVPRGRVRCLVQVLVSPDGFFFDLFLKAGKPAAYKFTLASVQGYVPDPAIQKSVCSGRQVMRDRSQTIAAIRPRIG